MSYIETLEDLLDKDGFECVDKDSFLKSAHYRYDRNIDRGASELINSQHTIDVRVCKLTSNGVAVEVDITVECLTDDVEAFYDCNFIHYVSVCNRSVIDLYQHIKVELLHLCKKAKEDGF